MITQEQVNNYNEIRSNNSLAAADQFASSIISSMNLKTPAERGQLWSEFKSESKAEKQADEKAKAAKLRKAKSLAKKNKVSIKKTCEAILLALSLSDYERKFLNDIKTKRKLTAKQESWLRSLAQKNSVKIVGNIENRASKSTVTHCSHEDLGSLGYAHGTTVKCPNCGSLAEVW